MHILLTEAERQPLWQLQKQRGDDEGYGKGTVVLLLHAGWGAAAVAGALGLDDGTVYRYARAFADLGLEKYLAHEQRGYWGRLTSAQLAGLCQALRHTLIHRLPRPASLGRAGLRRTLLRFRAPGPAAPVRLLLQAHRARALRSRCRKAAETGQCVVSFADAAHPTRCTRAWTDKGVARSLPTVSGRERVNRNAAVNAHCPPQVLLDETHCVNAGDLVTTGRKITLSRRSRRRDRLSRLA